MNDTSVKTLLYYPMIERSQQSQTGEITTPHEEGLIAATSRLL
jgi:hypothetical protein